MDASAYSAQNRYGIVGGGISGNAAKRLFRALGAEAPWVYDRQAAQGDYVDEKLFLADVRPTHLVVSPGVPLSTPWIQDFARAGGHITSELALAFETLAGERIVGVTGSLGKSTTVSLVGAAARAAGFEVFVGGNLGEPLAAYAADALAGRRPRADWIGLELSSYQLENAGRLRCEASVITYLSPNHLERYASLEDYYAVKETLCARTARFVALNENGGDLRARAAKLPGFAEKLWASRHSPVLGEWARELRLVGSHNRDNVALVAALAEKLGWDHGYRRGLAEFPGLAHRLEDLGLFGGVRFVNDSKGTSMDSVETALSAALESSAPRIWCLLGGKDKKLPWAQLAERLRDPRLKPVYFGECRETARAGVGRDGESFATLAAALAGLVARVAAEDWVVMSPGGTSLDEFRNFEERGEFFRRFVKESFGKEMK